ncbi:unnamed protein product [Colias eurytheme]|nr:unnamed protein product [Colias eurytheme]
MPYNFARLEGFVRFLATPVERRNKCCIDQGDARPAPPPPSPSHTPEMKVIYFSHLNIDKNILEKVRNTWI